MAKLYFHYSTMNAGKSTLLLQASYNYRERGMETYLLTAAIDGRAGKGKIGSRIGIDASADTGPMRTHLEALEHAHGDAAQSIAEADMALHRSFIEASGHTRLADAWEALADQTMLMMSALPAVDPDIQGPMGAHRSIVDAVAAGDADAAVAALTRHLDDAHAAMAPHFP